MGCRSMTLSDYSQGTIFARMFSELSPSVLIYHLGICFPQLRVCVIKTDRDKQVPHEKMENQTLFGKLTLKTYDKNSLWGR